MGFMYEYRAYGLNLKSEIELPELLQGDAPSDVVLRFGSLDWTPSKTDAFAFSHTEDGMYQWWEGIGTFLVRCGSEIIVDPAPDVEESRMRLFLLGAAMGAALIQRGFYMLHSSAVEVDGSAVLFIGGKGWGKSTLAAHLYAKGHRVLSDDVVAIKFDKHGVPWVVPSYPQLKLWPDAIETLGESPAGLPKLSERYEKRHRSVDDRFSDEVVRLKSIYTLSKGDRVAIQQLDFSEAVMQLIANLYAARFGKEFVRTNEAQYFSQTADLARDIPVFRIERPSDLKLLPDTIELLERHVSDSSVSSTYLMSPAKT